MGLLLDMISDAICQKQVSKANRSRRGITEYKPSQIGGFVESDIHTAHVVCSGDAVDLRHELIVSLCVEATNAGIPVVVLHQGDHGLCSKFRAVYQNHPSYQEVGPGAKRFDPLYQLTRLQISRMIVDTAPSRYGLTCDGEAYIDVLTGYLTGKGRMITLKGLYDCPHSRIPLLLSAAAGKQTLPSVLLRELQTDLAQGQKEAHKVKAYLTELYDECMPLLPADKNDYARCLSVFQAVRQGAILNLDIISDGNTLLLQLIAEQLRRLIRRQLPFFLVLDNIALREENGMKALSALKAGSFGCAVTGDDVFSLCDGDEKLFSTLLGDSRKWFVFHHVSGISADRWSAAFSHYQKIDTTYNYGRGYGQGSGSLFGGSAGGLSWNHSENSQQGYAYVNRDEAVIRGEEIQRLPVRSGYIYTAATREIAHISSFLPQ